MERIWIRELGPERVEELNRALETMTCELEERDASREMGNESVPLTLETHLDTVDQTMQEFLDLSWKMALSARRQHSSSATNHKTGPAERLTSEEESQDLYKIKTDWDDNSFTQAQDATTRPKREDGADIFQEKRFVSASKPESNQESKILLDDLKVKAQAVDSKALGPSIQGESLLKNVDQSDLSRQCLIQSKCFVL